MPFTAITDTAKVELNGHDVTTHQLWANVMHVTIPDADQSFANLLLIADAVKGVCNGNKDVWSAGAGLDNVTVTGLATATSPQAISAFAPGTVGTSAFDSFPGVAALVKLTTATRGRSFRGRIFLGPIANVDVQDAAGTLSTGYQGIVTTFLGALRTALQGLSLATDLCVASRVLGISTPVTNSVCETLTAYQRRRGLR